MPDCSACVRYTTALPGGPELTLRWPMTSAPAIRRTCERRKVAVSVVSPLTTVVWLRAPALLHDENSVREAAAASARSSTPMLLVEPWITSRVNGAISVSPPNVSIAPGGWLASVSRAVRGSSRRVAVAGQPAGVARREPELEVRREVVVGRRERPAGDAAERLERVRMAGPGQPVAVLELDVPRQAAGGDRAPLESVALPLKAIVSSTLQVVPAAGAVIVMTGTGGVPAVIGRLTVSVSPPGSRTRRRAV